MPINRLHDHRLSIKEKSIEDPPYHETLIINGLWFHNHYYILTRNINHIRNLEMFRKLDYKLNY